MELVLTKMLLRAEIMKMSGGPAIALVFSLTRSFAKLLLAL